MGSLETAHATVVTSCLLAVHHVLSDYALEQLDNIDQMYHDGLLTEKVQAADSEGRLTAEVPCVLLLSVGLVLLRVWMCARDVCFNVLACCTHHLLLRRRWKVAKVSMNWDCDIM